MPPGGIRLQVGTKLQKTTGICPSWESIEAQHLYVPAAWPNPCSCQKVSRQQPKGRNRCWLHNLTLRAAQTEEEAGRHYSYRLRHFSFRAVCWGDVQRLRCNCHIPWLLSQSHQHFASLMCLPSVGPLFFAKPSNGHADLPFSLH